MDESVAVRYKKVKLFDNVYVYVFKDIIKNAKYNCFDNSINYTKNGKQKVLYDIADPCCAMTDEKYGFSDYFDIDELCNYYNTDDAEKALEIFESECKSFFRFGIVEEDKESIKIINSPTTNLVNAESDSTFIDFSIEEVNSYGSGIFMTIDSIDTIMNNIENGKTDVVLNQLDIVKSLYETYEDYADEKGTLSSRGKQACVRIL